MNISTVLHIRGWMFSQILQAFRKKGIAKRHLQKFALSDVSNTQITIETNTSWLCRSLLPFPHINSNAVFFHGIKRPSLSLTNSKVQQFERVVFTLWNLFQDDHLSSTEQGSQASFSAYLKLNNLGEQQFFKWWYECIVLFPQELFELRSFRVWFPP